MTGKAAARGQQWSNQQQRRRPPLPDPPSPTPAAVDPRRSLRPRRGRPPISDDLADYCFSSSSEEELRGRRKVKLVVKIPGGSPAAAAAASSDSGCSTSFSDKEEEEVKPLKKRRRIGGCDDGGGSDGSVHQKGSKKNEVRRSKYSFSGASSNLPKRTPLPDRKALESILDMLQKKDTYGVFADPVDPEELPDYHEVIEHPMDFGTIRKKLARKVYRTFEQFEDDVFLICSNAMQYNAPDTIYFRQARAIESMARKNFQILRSDPRCIETEQKSEEKIISSSVDKKPMKKSLGRFEQEPVRSDISSTATFASAADDCTRFSMAPANAVEKPANADRLRMTRVNAVEKAASADKLSMVRPKTSEKHATATGLSTGRANAVVKPETANGLSLLQANVVEKHATPNALAKVQANDIAKPVTPNELRKTRPNGIEQPATANGLRTTRPNGIEQTATADGFSTTRPNGIEQTATANVSTTQPNGIEQTATANGLSTTGPTGIVQPVTANGLSTTGPNEIELPATATANALNIARLNGIEQPATANALSTTQVNGIEQPATANALSTTQVNGIEQPATANALSTTQVNGIEQPAIGNGLSTTEANAVDRHAVVGSMDCNSSLGESKPEKGESRSEKADDFSAKSSPSKSIRKSYLIDENRRATYNKSDQPWATETDAIFDVLDSEAKQLVSVGTHVEHSYARSLAQFAASLGPIGWEIAAKRIEKALPAGIKFGPGWVGEYEPLPTPILSFENQNQQPLRYNSKLQFKAAPNMDKNIEERSKTAQNCDSKDMQLGLKNRVIPEIPLRSPNPSDGTILGEQKQSWFGVSAESRQRITNAMIRQPKELVAIDVAKSYNNVSEQLDVCNSPSVNSLPVEKPPRIPEFHNDAHKQRLFGVSTETPPRVTSLMLQQQKDHVAIDFTKACKNVQEQPRVRSLSLSSSNHDKAALQRSEFLSEPSKQSLSGVTNMMLQQQKHQVTIDFTKACSDISEQIGMRNSASVISTPVETTLPRSDSSQAWKQGFFGISAETHPRVANVMLPHQKSQVSIDFGNAYNNISDQVRVRNSSSMSSSSVVEVASQRTESHHEVVISRPLGMISMSRNQVQPEPQKQSELVNSHSATDSLGLTVGGLSNKKAAGSSDNGGANTSLEFFSNHQPGVAGFRAARGSQEQVLDFKFMSSSRKVSDQPNNSKTNIYSTKHGMAPSTRARRDDPTAAKAVAASAGTQISYGVSAEYRPVDDMGHPNAQIGSSPFPSSAWRIPSAAARIHGDSMTRPMPQIFPHPILVAEESQFQNRGMVFFPQLVPTDLSRFNIRTPSQGLVPYSQPRQKDMLPPDLNIGFQPPGSPVRHSSGILIDSQQPDLALQL